MENPILLLVLVEETIAATLYSPQTLPPPPLRPTASSSLPAVFLPVYIYIYMLLSILFCFAVILAFF